MALLHVPLLHSACDPLELLAMFAAGWGLGRLLAALRRSKPF